MLGYSDTITILILILVEKTRWFRHCAVYERCQEGKEILQEEIGRVYISFSRMALIWTRLAGDGHWDNGSVCYAHKQAAVYQSLADATLDVVHSIFGQSVEW